MVNKIFCIVSLFLLLLLPREASAQFYQRSDSVARLIKSGVTMQQQRTDVKKTEAKKKGATKKKRGTANKKTAKVKKEKKSEGIVYEEKRYRLGERVIMRGDSGADVKSLANMLVKKLFLDENDIIYTKNGVLYDGEIIRAVRSFQKISGLYEDGMVGTPTLKALRKYR